MYPKHQPDAGVPASPSLPSLERDVLDYWAGDKTFQASIDGRDPGPKGANEFVFYDGPPFANGLPHYGHLLTGYVKDLVPRYQTMRGRRVERRFGWDCHGLPAEVEAEKQLGITTKAEILELGMQKFNDACRSSVLQYTKDWERYVTRQARWVDFANDYKTLDTNYMESVMWAFKSLYDKGLVYEGFSVLAYCWRCETPLSNTETRMDDVYQDRQDPALTVGFQLETGEKLLVWTTTPWTLPSNLAVAVGPDIDYAVLERAGERVILGAARVGAYAKELADYEPVGTVKGSDLVGRSYTPLFDFLADTPNAFRVLGGDFVSTEDGTGAVHMAPAFGEDDQRAVPRGRHTDRRHRRRPRSLHLARPAVPGDAGLRGEQADHARPQGPPTQTGTVVFRHESYTHSYPHCWRCDTPLIYKAVSSWFVAVSRFKDRMGELNQQIDWTPAHVRDGSFGKWLANARDWAISRNRFWGSPIPVWKSDDPQYPRVDVYGSVAQLEARFRGEGRRPAPAGHRRADAAESGRPDRQVDHAARAGGARLLVRVRVDAVRPGALPVRERRVVREPLSGRLHRRVSAAGPRLVLHHARARHGAVRPAGVPDVRGARHRARRRRPQDVQEPA